MRMMAALTPRAPFHVLIVSEQSRIGREQIEVSFALKQMVKAGVRVFCYLDDRERTLDSPIDKAMLALQAMADEMEREKARQRSHDKARALARAGRVSGGRCFGYDLVDVMADGTRMRRPRDGKRHPDASHVELAINDTEAAVIRRIFELAAAGIAQAQIAKQLNAEGAPAPRAQRGRPQAWVPHRSTRPCFAPVFVARTSGTARGSAIGGVRFG